MTSLPDHSSHRQPAHQLERLVRVLIVWCMLHMLLGVEPSAAQPDPASSTLALAYADVLPSLREPIINATATQLSRYILNVEVRPAERAIVGTMSVDYVNTTGQTLAELYFRLYPNADHYGDGALDVRNVTVAGVATASETSTQDTVLRVPLGDAFASGLPPNEHVLIAMDFTVTVPTDSIGSYGIFSYVSATKTWVLADWHPVVAAYEGDEGWQLDPPLGTVDPTFAESALYDVTLTTPADWTVATSGRALPADSSAEITSGLTRTTRYIAGPIREFSMAMDDNYEVEQVTVGETVVRLLSNPDHQAPLDEALAVAAAALAQYNAHFGAYPFAELDLVDTPLTPGTLGVSWGGIVFVDGSSLAAQPGNVAYYDFLIAHEIAHQWIGGIIGINSNDHTFIAEGLTNYIMTMFVEWERGPEAAIAMLESSVASRYQSLLRSSGDQVADVPWQAGAPGFADVIYGKAALGFLAIRLEIGDDAFVEAIRSLATPGDGFAFAIADPADFLAAFEAASGADLDSLWETWFLSARTTPDEVRALLSLYRGTVAEPAAA